MGADEAVDGSVSIYSLTFILVPVKRYPQSRYLAVLLLPFY